MSEATAEEKEFTVWAITELKRYGVPLDIIKRVLKRSYTLGQKSMADSFDEATREVLGTP